MSAGRFYFDPFDPLIPDGRSRLTTPDRDEAAHLPRLREDGSPGETNHRAGDLAAAGVLIAGEHAKRNAILSLTATALLPFGI